MLCRAALPLVLLALALLPGCDHPLRDRDIAALGPEDPDVPQGPLHRPGQPCLLCHDGDFASPLRLAGTLYYREDGNRPATAAVVTFRDAHGKRFKAATNCAGNFLVRPTDFEPTFPVWVSVAQGEEVQTMESPIHVDGSCAGCHSSQTAPDKAPRVYVAFEGDPPVDPCE